MKKFIGLFVISILMSATVLSQNKTESVPDFSGTWLDSDGYLAIISQDKSQFVIHTYHPEWKIKGRPIPFSLNGEKTVREIGTLRHTNYLEQKGRIFILHSETVRLGREGKTMPVGSNIVAEWELSVDASILTKRQRQGDGELGSKMTYRRRSENSK